MKLQICRGNLPYVSVPRWWRKFQGIKRRLRKPNHTSADQSTSTRILTGILSSLFLVPWVYGSFISLGYPQNSWGVEVNPSPKIRCFTLMPTPLVAILYFPLTSLVFFGFPIQRTAIPTTRLRPSEKRELFRKLFLNNFCKHVLELYCSSITWPAETCHWSCSPWRCFTLGDWPVEPVLCCLISPSTEAIVKGTFFWNL